MGKECCGCGASSVGQAVFTVPDMSCGHCKAAVEKGLRSAKGVKTVEVDLESKVVSVSYDPGATDREQIKKVIEEAGYSPE